MHETARPRARRWEAIRRVLLALAPSLLSSCYGPFERETCTTQADCRGSVCNARGFCESECRDNVDCPCGSVCSSCGVCLTLAAAAPATCFTLNVGVAAADLHHACVPYPAPDGGDDLSACPSPPVCRQPDAAPAPEEDAPDAGAEEDAGADAGADQSGGDL